MSIVPSGWIYAAREDGTPLVKIGCTTRLLSYDIIHEFGRIRELKARLRVDLTCVGIVPVYFARPFLVERRIHTMLAAQRIQGEWFYLFLNQETLSSLVAQATDYLVGMHEDDSGEMLPSEKTLVLA